MALTHKDVTEILKIIDESDLDELVIEIAGAKLEIRRRGPDEPAEVSFTPSSDEPESSIIHGESEELPTVDTTPTSRRHDGVEVRAPMVGTFYRQPAPGEPPFVEVGSMVAAGDSLCLIEVMKLFTTIEAPAGGEILEIQAEDSEMVEHGQVLFVIGIAE
ncbi:MAG: acetyl-CoA carboxylase biotin carboxyl carrier protein [Alphaproteobacteria bacterium]|nr:acetyl-CoA carboxylase biotin carboxyl carrier protein [Alphaproteobacteria bacterium]